MRVISGTARGKILQSVPGLATRPPLDRVKEALFSILQSRYEFREARILDIFSGTGSLGIEALSRGAARVTFVEQAGPAVEVLRANLTACRFGDRAEILTAPATKAVKLLADRDETFDGVFIDPPYRTELLAQTLEVLGASSILCADGWVLAKHEPGRPIADQYGNLQLTLSRRYGMSVVVLFSASPPAA